MIKDTLSVIYGVIVNSHFDLMVVHIIHISKIVHSRKSMKLSLKINAFFRLCQVSSIHKTDLFISEHVKNAETFP